jgi:uncharacterized protein YjbI with pentapeptide repeats
MSGGECDYEFDPVAWEKTTGRLGTVTSTYTCDRPAVGETDYCHFHLSPERYEAAGLTTAEVQRRFQSELNSADAEPLRLIGAAFDSLDLAHEVLDGETNRPIDLRHARFDSIDATHAIVRQPLRLDEAVVAGPVDLSNASFTHAVRFTDATFEGSVEATGVSFTARADWSDADFEGAVSFRRASFGADTSFHAATFGDRATYDDVEFLAVADFGSAWFGAGASFLHASFGGRTDFRDVRFDRATERPGSAATEAHRPRTAVATTGSGHPADDGAGQSQGSTTGAGDDAHGDTDPLRARFTDSEFDREALFGRAQFGGDALFKSVIFGGAATFQNARFDGELSFSGASFAAGGSFQFAAFRDEASISYAAFDDSAYFGGAEFHGYCSFYQSTFDDDADFRGVTYERSARYKDVSFGRRAYFDRATFGGRADFEGVDFGDSVQFVGTTFDDRFDAADATVSHGRFDCLRTPDDHWTVDLTGSHVRSGELRQAADDGVYYDLTDAVVGEVDLTLDGGGTPFDRLRIYRTDFDGFDFPSYRSTLAPEWTIHTRGRTDDGTATEADPPDEATTTDVEGTIGAEAAGDDGGRDGDSDGDEHRSAGRKGLLERLRERIASTDAAGLETTYLKAKNGATQVGDNRAASAFFVKEMQYRRRTHLQTALDSDAPRRRRRKAAVQWGTNLLLGATCGFGERPQRTLVAAVAFVLLYAGLFAVLLPQPPYGTLLGYFVLSVESFTTLVIAGGAPVSDPMVRAIADVEGFVGAFFVGLFVFALTRNVHR